METILIKNARILCPAQGMELHGDILVENGLVAAMGFNISRPGARVLNAEGLIAAPGLIDMHVHLREPGFTEKEDILSGCRAAAAGGVTGLLCMPNTRPTLDTPEAVRYVLEKSADADAHVYVAAAITKGLASEELTDFAALRKAGATALSDDGRPVTNTRLMAEAMCTAPSHGLHVVSHCEDLFLTAGGLMHEGAVSAELGIAGVPAAGEDCGTARELAVAEAYGAPVHICHVSTKTSVALIRAAKARGVHVTAETAPHYFSLTDEELRTKDADYRMSPPLRTEQDRLAIIEGICDGTIDAIATDHAPHTPGEKSDFAKAPNGAVGMETSLAAGITCLVRPGFISMERLLVLMSAAPAEIIGVAGGRLAQGLPADIVVFNSEEAWQVEPDKLHGKSRNAVFKGRSLYGRVKYTVCGGRLVYEDQSM